MSLFWQTVTLLESSILINIEIARGKYDTISLCENDTKSDAIMSRSVELAHRFCKMNKLEPEIIAPLSRYIRTVAGQEEQYVSIHLSLTNRCWCRKKQSMSNER